MASALKMLLLRSGKSTTGTRATSGFPVLQRRQRSHVRSLSPAWWVSGACQLRLWSSWLVHRPLLVRDECLCCVSSYLCTSWRLRWWPDCATEWDTWCGQRGKDVSKRYPVQDQSAPASRDEQSSWAAANAAAQVKKKKSGHAIRHRRSAGLLTAIRKGMTAFGRGGERVWPACTASARLAPRPRMGRNLPSIMGTHTYVLHSWARRGRMGGRAGHKGGRQKWPRQTLAWPTPWSELESSKRAKAHAPKRVCLASTQYRAREVKNQEARRLLANTNVAS